VAGGRRGARLGARGVEMGAGLGPARTSLAPAHPHDRRLSPTRLARPLRQRRQAAATARSLPSGSDCDADSSSPGGASRNSTQPITL
jgi:hypothetical protein